MPEWKEIKKRDDLPPAGKTCFVTRIWPGNKRTVDQAFMGIWKNRRLWVAPHTVCNEDSKAMTGDEFQYTNVIAWMPMDTPQPFQKRQKLNQLAVFDREQIESIPGNH